mgnify:CR=1 FL=1
MCIGVPGQVLAVGEDIHQLAQVEVCGITVSYTHLTLPTKLEV